MNAIYKSTAVLLLMLPLSGASFAAEPMQGMNMNKPQGADAGKHEGMGMMGMGMSEEHLRAMQEHMLQMHDLSNQILAEKDPAKQAQLKNQQLELMKAHQAKMMQHHSQMMQGHQ
jgi:hypothetical protein